MKRYDALVIGGGPAGAATALLLARRGWSVALVERSPFPRGKVCGEYLSPAALALLHEVGLADLCAGGGPEVRRVALWAGTGSAMADLPSEDGLAKYGRALAREALDTRLLQQAEAAGAQLVQPARARTVAGTPGAFECDIEQGGARLTLKARCVIAAHGSWTAGELPTQLRRQPSRPDDLLAFKTYLESVLLAPDVLPLLVFPGGYAGLLHAGCGRVNLSCCVRRDALADLRARFPGVPAGAALLRHLSSASDAARVALANARPAHPWLACGPLRPGARSASVGGLYSVGNAAAEAHPLIGEGVTMALQSAHALCTALNEAAAGDWEEAASRYERSWRSLVASRVRVSGWYARLALHPRAAAAAVSAAARVPVLLSLAARWKQSSADVA